jgi:simple sugar transport system permease protein
VVDLGLEGKMLFAAFAAAAGGVASGSLLVALACACGVAILMSWVHAYACVSHRGDQVVSGMALNIIAAGLTVVLGIAWFAQGGQTPPVADTVRLTPLWPGAAAFGPILGEGLLGHNALVYSRSPSSSPSGGWSTARASGCACARSARTRTWSRRRGSRCCACATPRSR